MSNLDIGLNNPIIWEDTNNLAPFEMFPGELQHLAENGSHISSLVVDTIPTEDVVIEHEVEFSAGSEVAYQGVLTQEEIEVMGATRPPAVVGSYSVSDKDGMKYSHIPCPIARDGINYVWGTIAITYIKTEVRDGENVDVYSEKVSFKKSDLLTLTVPFTIYGLLTLGYTGVGGTDYFNTLLMSNGYHTPASDGTVDSVSVYGNSGTGTVAATHGVYLNGGGANNDPTTRILVTTAGDMTTTPGWWTLNAASESIVTTSSYYIASVLNSATVALHIKGDNTGTLLLRYRAIAGAYPCPDPFGTVSVRYSNYRFSMYATYTAGGAPATGFMTLNKFWGM